MDQLIIAYDVLASDQLADLKNKVNAALAAGWQPYGNFLMVKGEEDLFFYQAVVRYTN